MASKYAGERWWCGVPRPDISSDVGIPRVPDTHTVGHGSALPLPLGQAELGPISSTVWESLLGSSSPRVGERSSSRRYPGHGGRLENHFQEAMFKV